MKISVIVPVYNVKDYLERCLQSLINQTYADFEIILVDDGSTDESGNICDEYAKNYDFIRALHKSNGGLSSARNFALDHINGDYVAFVDSDDYVENDYLETLFTLTEKGTHEVVSVAHCNEYIGEPVTDIKVENKKRRKLSVEEALKALCYESELSTSACTKLFAKRLVTENKFPLGRIYEDLFTVYKIIGAANSVVVSNEIKYHYTQRKGSIRTSSWSDRVFDIWDATHNFIEYVKNYYPNLQKDSINRLFISANEIYIRAFNERNFIEIIKPVKQEIKKFYSLLKNNVNITKKNLFKYSLMVRHPRLYRLIWEMYH